MAMKVQHAVPDVMGTIEKLCRVINGVYPTEIQELARESLACLKATSGVGQNEYTLQELLAGITPENCDHSGDEYEIESDRLYDAQTTIYEQMLANLIRYKQQGRRAPLLSIDEQIDLLEDVIALRKRR